MLFLFYKIFYNPFNVFHKSVLLIANNIYTCNLWIKFEDSMIQLYFGYKHFSLKDMANLGSIHNRVHRSSANACSAILISIGN